MTRQQRRSKSQWIRQLKRMGYRSKSDIAWRIQWGLDLRRRSDR